VTRLEGLWRLEVTPGEVGVGASGHHAYYFSAHGELVDLMGPDVAQRSLLSWKLRGNVLVIDQPSAPREELVTVLRASEHTMQLGTRWYVREPDAKLDPEIPFAALMAGAAWHGVASAHEAEPFIPFLMTELGARRLLQRVVAGSSAEAEETANRLLQRTEHERAMWARDGRVTQGGVKLDAVVIARYERGRHTHDIALPYRFVGEVARIAGPFQMQAIG
jgi:hypothetical protein